MRNCRRGGLKNHFFFREIVSSSLAIRSFLYATVVLGPKIIKKDDVIFILWLNAKLVPRLLALLGSFFALMTILLGMFFPNVIRLIALVCIITKSLLNVITYPKYGDCSFLNFQTYLFFTLLFEVIFNTFFFSQLSCGVAVLRELKQHSGLLFYTFRIFFTYIIFIDFLYSYRKVLFDLAAIETA